MEVTDLQNSLRLAQEEAGFSPGERCEHKKARTETKLPTIGHIVDDDPCTGFHLFELVNVSARSRGKASPTLDLGTWVAGSKVAGPACRS